MGEKGNTMLRQLIITAGLALCAQAVHAAEAGKVIFVAGKAQVAERAATEGAAVQEGDMLSTGADGFIYVKTIDKGLFILRPNTRARIAAYHVDAGDPKNTRIKLELLSGVARSRSGEAVKLARQNFRFNTPVAAIGVRGTDFTVFTDDSVSRVAVLSGGIVMSGFEGACRPEGSGPCEGNASRELTAQMRGQLLQFQKGQAAPLLMQGGVLSPDQLAPPRGDEPVGLNGAGGGASLAGKPDLDPGKLASLGEIGKTGNGGTPSKPAQPEPPPVVTPPVVEVPVPPPVVVVPEQLVSWGRFQTVLDQSATIDANAAGQTLVAINPLFAITRGNTGTVYQAPERGSVGFSLKQSEAYLVEDFSQKKTLATLSNGVFNVNFDKATFATGFDLAGGGTLYKMRAEGTIAPNGQLYGNGQLSYPSNMEVSGTLRTDGAVYLFDGRLGPYLTAMGATVWGK
jgi:hypothetical protein